MDIEKLVKLYYKIGIIVDLRKTVFGSGNTFVIKTESERYIAKLNNKANEIEIYNRVQKQLLLSGVNQPRIILTKYKKLIAPHGLVLYEYIQGDTFSHFDKDMEEKALRYIFKYNQELKNVQFEGCELLVQNDWDRIKSLDYICNEVPQRIIDLKIKQEWKEALLDGIEVLTKYKEQLGKLDKQIIHSDLGADNFLVLNNEICAIIDFSLEINHELYSLAHFIYWNYMWSEKELEKKVIDRYINNYYGYINNANKDAYLLLLRASLFRVLGPLFEISHSEIRDYTKLRKRIELLMWIKKVLISSMI